MEWARECGRTQQSKRRARRVGRDIGLGMCCATPERTSNVDVGVAEMKIMRSSWLEESARAHQSERFAGKFLCERAKSGYRIRGGSSMRLPPRMTARTIEGGTSSAPPQRTMEEACCLILCDLFRYGWDGFVHLQPNATLTQNNSYSLRAHLCGQFACWLMTFPNGCVGILSSNISPTHSYHKRTIYLSSTCSSCSTGNTHMSSF